MQQCSWLIPDLCIENCLPKKTIQDKINKYHIDVITPISEELGFSVWASEKSGYRSPKYEKLKGRSGYSQHCFNGKGAVDWTCDKQNLVKLLMALVKSDYMRVCLYPDHGFIHCDYKGNQKLLFKFVKGKWIRQG
jgi:uncharacterized protein YcbK (DUF882 family)